MRTSKDLNPVDYRISLGFWPLRPLGGGYASRAFGKLYGSGDEGDRTLNLRLAKPALSQLSYVPGNHLQVGVLGFEPRTSALSELRSSQLSYTRFLAEGTKKPNRYRFGSTRLMLLDRASRSPFAE